MVLFMVAGRNGQNGPSAYVGIKIERERAHNLHLQMEDYLALILTWSIYYVSQPIGMVSKNVELMAKWANYLYLCPYPYP